FRDEPEFRCCWLVQQPNGHFGDTIARQLLFSAYQARLYAALESSDDTTLQAIAAKASREVRYHLEHAGVWVLRLAGGTELSRGRILQSILDLWPYVAELFEDDDLTTRLAPRTVPLPSSLRPGFDDTVSHVFARAEIELPNVPAAKAGGRRGRHSTLLGYILPEMQSLARRFPVLHGDPRRAPAHRPRLRAGVGPRRAGARPGGARADDRRLRGTTGGARERERGPRR